MQLQYLERNLNGLREGHKVLGRISRCGSCHLLTVYLNCEGERYKDSNGCRCIYLRKFCTLQTFWRGRGNLKKENLGYCRFDFIKHAICGLNKRFGKLLLAERALINW